MSIMALLLAKFTQLHESESEKYETVRFNLHIHCKQR